jgi:DNA-binding PadR family transcriptional regulator
VILTDAQVLVLLELANSGPLRPTILNHATLSALVRRKLAERDDTPNGRFYAITPAGWDELREGASAPPGRKPRTPRSAITAEERTLPLPLETES